MSLSGETGQGTGAPRARAARTVGEARAWINHAKVFGRSAAGLGAGEPGEAGDGGGAGFGFGPPDPAARDALIERLHALEGELAAGAGADDPTLALVRARLGGLYTLRHLVAPDDGDRAEGLRALNAARESGALDPKEETVAAVHKMGLLTPPVMLSGLDGTLPRLKELIELGERTGRDDPELDASLAELRDLVALLVPKMPDQRAAEQLSLLMEWLDQRPRDGQVMDPERFARAARETVAGLQPGSSHERLLDACLMLLGATGTPREGERGSDSEGDAGDMAGRIDRTILNLEVFAPGTIRPEELDALVTQFVGRPGVDESDTATAALARMAQGLRTGEPGDLEDAARLMSAAVRGAQGTPGKESDWLERFIGQLSPGLLSAAAVTGGSLTDRDRTRALLDALVGPGADGIDLPPGALTAQRDLLQANQSLRLQLRADQAYRDRDTALLEELLDEMLDLQDRADPDADWNVLIGFGLGMIHLFLALLEGGTVAVRTASAYFRQALEHPRIPALLRPMLETAWVPVVLLSSLFEPEPGPVLEAVERARAGLSAPSLVLDQPVRTRMVIALAFQSLHRTTGDPSHQDTGIAELELARRELTERHSPQVTHEVLWALARAYQERGDRDRDRGDRRAAVAAAQESLRSLAEEVLLQLGAEHGLEVARAAAERALLAVRWAADDGRVDKAVEVLENGRALVLRAAAVSAGVPEQLTARGEPELAEEWAGALRRLPPPAAPSPTPVDGTGGTGGPAALEEARAMAGQLLSTGEAAGFTIPSTLRRRALSVLRRPDGGRHSLRELLDAPGIEELREGLRAAGADALIHLVPGRGTADGLAVLVRPRGEPEILPLPGLGAPGREPLERYLDAGARRSAARDEDPGTRDEAHRRWEAALEALCDWAGPAVLAPVLGALGVPVPVSVPPADRGAPGTTAPPPVRITLVACGNLGAVPWHAGRLGPSATRPGRRVHACEYAVISYAASGGEFLRSVRRGRTPVGLRPVLVADPTGDLDWARDEVSALRTAFYPGGAAVHGWHQDAPEDAPGTPDDILAQLPGGDPAGPPASLLHLVVHGVAGLSPTDSVLRLAAPGGVFDPSSDAARLTVTRVMDVPGGRYAADGPLIVLSACETDLSSRDHDEALTPTTALLARGAADVVGSRWEVPDSASAVLMVVFHHHIAVRGLAPPDALRAAQLWMTDPDRRSVPGLRGDLLAKAERDPGSLAALSSWAAFIHQGNPAPRTGAGGTTA
ncbi:hypothetical protein GCM10010232_59390 [Streptomyces amakusaensis]|uniref:CHAT domain-containing protein n=1 Tax=Streptomyces amakusaensis TaxID=67271 RepID=A0ABW0AUW6_9ACTN